MVEDFSFTTWNISFIRDKIGIYVYALPSVWSMGLKCLCHRLYSWSGCVGARQSVWWLESLALCVCRECFAHVNVSLRPASGPARGRPQSTFHVSMCGTCGPLRPASTSGERVREAEGPALLQARAVRVRRTFVHDMEWCVCTVGSHG